MIMASKSSARDRTAPRSTCRAASTATARAAAVSASASLPASGVTISAAAPLAKAATGVPQDIASTRVSPNGSAQIDDDTNTAPRAS